MPLNELCLLRRRHARAGTPTAIMRRGRSVSSTSATSRRDDLGRAGARRRPAALAIHVAARVRRNAALRLERKDAHSGNCWPDRHPDAHSNEVGRLLRLMSAGVALP